MLTEELYFAKQLDAVAFLQESGFKISKSKFNRDFNAGLIPCTTDKRFCATYLLAYAEREVSAPVPAAEREQTPPKKRGRPKKTPAESERLEQDEYIFLRPPEDAVEVPILCFSQGIEKEEHPQNTPPKRNSSRRHVFRKLNETPVADVLPRDGIYDSVTHIDFRNKFCLTGIFAFGERAECEQAICEKGGTITEHPNKDDCYLVVGTFASPDWSHVNYGTKIERALQSKKNGGSIRILSEDAWINALIEKK